MLLKTVRHRSREIADSITLMSTRTNDERGRTYAHFYYGLIDRSAQDYVGALEHFREFVDYRVSIGDSLGVASGLFQVGAIHNALGNSNGLRKRVEVSPRRARAAA